MLPLQLQLHAAGSSYFNQQHDPMQVPLEKRKQIVSYSIPTWLHVIILQGIREFWKAFFTTIIKGPYRPFFAITCKLN
jgi:hypothetical protein